MIETQKEPIHMRATFLIIERPLIPPPPLDAQPSWYLSNTLGFYDSTGAKVWEQKIPEVELRWIPYNPDPNRDEFTSYFHAELFKEERFGWQLRIKCSHERAQLLGKVLGHLEQYHKEHFLKVESK